MRRLRVVLVWCWRCSPGEEGLVGGRAGPGGGALPAPQVWVEQGPEERIMGNFY